MRENPRTGPVILQVWPSASESSKCLFKWGFGLHSRSGESASREAEARGLRLDQQPLARPGCCSVPDPGGRGAAEVPDFKTQRREGSFAEGTAWRWQQGEPWGAHGTAPHCTEGAVCRQKQRRLSAGPELGSSALARPVAWVCTLPTRKSTLLSICVNTLIP